MGCGGVRGIRAAELVECADDQVRGLSVLWTLYTVCRHCAHLGYDMHLLWT